MPLLYKPRDPNYGVRKVRKRNVIRRKPICAFVLPETKKFIESKLETISPGQMIDAAIKLYVVHRELSEVLIREREFARLQSLRTSVSQETIAYFHFMRGVMTPGELIDAAVPLYRKLTQQDQ